MRSSLFRRVAWAQAGSLGALVVLLLGLEFGSSFLGYSSDFDQTMRPYAMGLALLLADESDPRRIEEVARKIQDLDERTTWPAGVRPAGYQAYYQVLDARGAMLFRTAGTPPRPYTSLGPGFHVVRVDGRRTRVLVEDAANGRIRVIIGESLPLRRAAILRSMRMLPVSYLLILLPMVLFTWVATRRALRPLRQLADAVEARAATDLGPLDPTVDLKEVRPLLSALNRHMARVSGLIESQRRFVADAAHSLRTPLAVLGAQAHALVQAPGPGEREQLGGELRAGIERATSVVHQLLSVARLEGAGPDPVTATVDLAELARERVALLVPLALRRGQDLGVEGPDHLPCRAHGAMLATALDNLLENALRYTPEGGVITLRLGRDGARCWCEVEDDGPGIPDSFREQAFDRFARAPGAPGHGAGLGLSIVRKALDLHHGTVSLLDPPGGRGLRVRIEI
ncbi:sensor histidine kinase [Mesoterricola silvestris]|uniref:histidine kinase n=1 Tax=Mesoterricola silvestris TaxID=2927979 RepID=A0AA48GJ44_9BACT|nr:ATP-binding protein [Mesoterricola silvestris]BDU72039.1 hypothetical protein METEAL_12130 [Mesoterricola silvestris]